MINLKPYQQDAVDRLVSAMRRNLARKTGHSVVFQAPTGSGKTVMVQEAIRRLLENTPANPGTCVLWLSIGDLSEQSKASFERNASGGRLSFLSLEDVPANGKILEDGDILFLNWEALNRVDGATGEWKVTAMRDNEGSLNVPSYLEATHAAGRDVILVVDECHRQLNTPKTQALIREYFKPALQLEVSATPDTEKAAERVEVERAEVVRDGMIKTCVAVNEGLEDFTDGGEEATDAAILAAALAKRDALEAAFAKTGATVRPLVLVQLPNEGKSLTEQDQTKMGRVKGLLATRYGVSAENGKLAVWLSGDKDKINLATEISGKRVRLEDPNSPVDVLIFKQAAATGWDCPRAHILVMFRTIKSLTFEMQTIGRILRMPEQKHYGDDALDRGYIYTDYRSSEVAVGKTAKRYVMPFWSKRKTGIECPKLPSVYRGRADFNDIEAEFYVNGYLEAAIQEALSLPGPKSGRDYSAAERAANLAALVKKYPAASTNPPKDTLLKDARLVAGEAKILVDVDEMTGEKQYQTVQTTSEEELAELLFWDFCRRNVAPDFGGVARSWRKVFKAIIFAVQGVFLGAAARPSEIVNLALSAESFFLDALNAAKAAYAPAKRAGVAKRAEAYRESGKRMWTVPTTALYPDGARKLAWSKFAHEQGYFAPESEGEEIFARMIDAWASVDWWWRNGVGEEHLAIPYEKDTGKDGLFYPDFVVRFADGTIGAFDTKSGRTMEEGHGRLRGLLEWLVRLNNSGIRAFGGLVFAEKVGGDMVASFTDNPSFESMAKSRKDFRSLTAKTAAEYDFARFKLGKSLAAAKAKPTAKEIEKLRKELAAAEKELADFRAAQDDAAEWDLEGVAEKQAKVEQLLHKLGVDAS